MFPTLAELTTRFAKQIHHMKTKDPVNQHVADQFVELGPEELGLMNNSGWSDDPKRLVFTLSRYTFVAKMLA
jgi:hypothetical protein